MWGGGGKGRRAESTLFVSPEIKGDFKTLFLSQRQKAYIFISLECYRKYVTMGLFRGLIASLSKDVGTAHKWVYPPPPPPRETGCLLFVIWTPSRVEMLVNKLKQLNVLPPKKFFKSPNFIGLQYTAALFAVAVGLGFIVLPTSPVRLQKLRGA